MGVLRPNAAKPTVAEPFAAFRASLRWGLKIGVNLRTAVDRLGLQWYCQLHCQLLSTLEPTHGQDLGRTRQLRLRECLLHSKVRCTKASPSQNSCLRQAGDAQQPSPLRCSKLISECVHCLHQACLKRLLFRPWPGKSGSQIQNEND